MSKKTVKIPLTSEPIDVDLEAQRFGRRIELVIRSAGITLRLAIDREDARRVADVLHEVSDPGED